MDTFRVDNYNSDDEYLYVDIPPLSCTIVLFLDENEKLNAQIFPLEVADEPTNSLIIETYSQE